MSTSDSEAYSGVRLTRVLKLIRPVKLVKLVRLARAFQISRSDLPQARAGSVARRARMLTWCRGMEPS
jgi:hypothetical protein